MPRYAYVNGRYLPQAEATVSIDDRGYQFADGVYEVVPLIEGRVVDEDAHLDRLEYSLRELSIPMPMSRAALRAVTREMMRRNGVRTGIVYMQVTRGVALRDHRYPENVKPSLVMTARHKLPVPEKRIAEGVSVVSIPDLRWGRCDIKATSLLANIMGKHRPMIQPVGGQTLPVYRLLVPRVDIKPSSARRLVDFAGDKKENVHPITDYFYHVGGEAATICFSGNEPTC